MSPFTEAAALLTVTGAAAAVTTVAADSMDKAPAATAVLLWAAGVVTALGVLWKFLHIGEISKGLRHLVQGWNGQPERPGFDRVPGVPERLAKIEKQTHEVKGAMPAMVVALDELQRWATENGSRIDAVNERITEHRRRNDDQAALLRKELEDRASKLEAKLDARNAVVDERLDHLSDDLLRAETYRASLVELHGIDAERRQQPRDE